MLSTRTAKKMRMEVIKKADAHHSRRIRKLPFYTISEGYYLRGFLIFACAAARRAIGTL